MQSIKKLFVIVLLCFVLFSTSTVSARGPFSAADEALLDDLQRRLFQYFWEQADQQTGIVPDRARTDGSALDANHQNV
ncbi:MAG TPA: hypothetical protein VFS77_11200, partial [Pyrinomonadaceae bacterium]|nr:hypothetical protein [Pyrinomonadaceae bacterium]